MALTPEERRERALESNRKWKRNNPDKVRAHKRDGQKRRLERMTPEQYEAYLAERREYMRRHRATLSPERKELDRYADRIRARERYERLSDEEYQRRLTKNNESRRVRAANMTLEERRAFLDKKNARYLARVEAKRRAAEEARKANAAAWRKESRAAFDADPTALYRRIMKAIPPLPADVRDDVAADIAVALLDGEIGLHEIGGFVRKFISAHFRQREWSKVLSLDAPVPGTDGNVTYLDCVADGEQL